VASEPTIIMRGGGLLAGGPAGREPQKHDRKGRRRRRRRRMRAGAGSALHVPRSHLDLADSAHVPAPSRKIDYPYRYLKTYR
jgi:hypothetical protein